MHWTPQAILADLRRAHAQGQSVAYRPLSRTHRALVSAAAYHFGSLRKAVEQAGIDYGSVTGRPRWTKGRVIATIKSARRAGTDLSWAAVTARPSQLRRAAFVAVRPGMFGSWPRALQAAGLDDQDSRRYVAWDQSVIAIELKQRRANRKPMNSAAVRQEDPAMHAAAVRHFGSYGRALRAAGIDPASVRLRRSRVSRRVETKDNHR